MNLVFMGIIGAVCLFVGVRARLGYVKAWYLAKGIPVLVPDAAKHILIPLGLICLAFELIGSNLIPFEARASIALIVITPLFLLMVILAVWQPSWLLPNWLSFLRQTYGEGMTDAMLAEASKDIPAWLKQVETHEGLVTWADKTSRELRFGTHQSHLDNNPPKDE